MLGDFTIFPVNPRDAGWAIPVLFKHEIRYRIMLPETATHWMVKMNAMRTFSMMMTGEEGTEWLIQDFEIYCASIEFLVMARLSEDESFEKLVGRIEERNDNE